MSDFADYEKLMLQAIDKNLAAAAKFEEAALMNHEAAEKFEEAAATYEEASRMLDATANDWKKARQAIWLGFALGLMVGFGVGMALWIGLVSP